MMFESRKRPRTEYDHPTAKQTKQYAIDTANSRAIKQATQLQSAFLCVLQLQARTLDRFRANGDWIPARDLLIKTEITRRVIIHERRNMLLARENTAMIQPTSLELTPESKSSKRVSFNELVQVHNIPLTDRSRIIVSQVVPEELLMVKATGLQSIPKENFSEFW